MSSPADKYELILTADPRSRIFVELTRALVERGDHARAVEVARAGLTHHPDSAQARALLGRALLALGRNDEALDALEAAARAAPADHKVRDLLEEARAAAPAAGPGAVAELELSDGPAATIEFFAVSPGEVASDGGNSTETATDDETATPTPSPTSTDDETATPNDDETAALPVGPGWARGHRATAPASPETASHPAAPDEAALAATSAAASGEEPEVTDRRWLVPPPLQKPPAAPPGSPLHFLPTEPRREVASGPGLPPDPEEAARIADRYERELREKMLAGEAPPRSRHLGPALIFGALLLLVVGSAATYYLVRRAHRADEARAAVSAARAGLARDTLGSLREAARALEEARALDPDQVDATSMAAQVNALLWTDFADEKALERARALASSPAAGEGGRVARYLTAPGAPEREQAAEDLLSAAPGSGPLPRIVAGGLLRFRGDREGARQALEVAAKAAPPMLRALADLGDLAAPSDPEQALRFYRTALQVVPTHPRSVLGAAEAHLALGRGLADALAGLEAMQRDPQSLPPGPDRLRAELLRARLLAGLGRAPDAAAALEEAAGRFPGRPEVPAALAEMELARGAADQALAAAERARRISPADESLRELLARARLARGRYRELLRETEGGAPRPLRLLRAQAWVELGELEKALVDLEAMRRDGRLPAEAAAWMAFCEAASGRRAQASAVLQALGEGRQKLPVAMAAQARLLAAEGRGAGALEALRAAAALDGAPALARIELARLLRDQGQPARAVEALGPALERNPFHPGGRLVLAGARLEAGDAAGAAADAGRALEDRPRDAEALRILSAARLALGDKASARSAAEKAIQAAPRDPAAWIAAGRASVALGRTAAARGELTRAARLAGKGPLAAQAQQLLGQLPRR